MTFMDGYDFKEFAKRLNEVKNDLEILNVSFHSIGDNVTGYTDTDLENLTNQLNSFYKKVDLMKKECTMIKRCKDCKKPFITTRSNRLYCDRFRDDGRRCGAPYTLNQTFLKEDLDLYLADDLYAKHLKMKLKEYKEKLITMEELITWKTDAREKLEETKAGLMNVDEFRDWISKK